MDVKKGKKKKRSDRTVFASIILVYITDVI